MYGNPYSTAKGEVVLQRDDEGDEQLEICGELWRCRACGQALTIPEMNPFVEQLLLLGVADEDMRRVRRGLGKVLCQRYQRKSNRARSASARSMGVSRSFFAIVLRVVGCLGGAGNGMQFGPLQLQCEREVAVQCTVCMYTGWVVDERRVDPAPLFYTVPE